MQYRVIDADSHVNEPGDVWVTRVPAKYKDMVPKVVDLPGGKIGWSYMNGQRIRPIAMESAAGMDSTEYDPTGVPKEKVRPGNFEPKARIADMEADMVDAQVIYPGVALTGANSYSEDRDIQNACVRAYNDWLLDEFCGYNKERLIGLPISPTTGIEDLVLEWKRVERKGAKGLIIAAYPNGTNEPKPEDERFWSEIEEWDYPVHIHFGFFGAIQRSVNPTPKKGGIHPTSTFLNRLGMGVYKPLADLLHNGLFEKHPKLKVVAVETGIGWIPFYLETIDDNFLRHRWQSGVHLKRMPSEYFRDHIWATFVTDPIGVDLRHSYNIDHIMWSTDYPHVQTDWPNSKRVMNYEFRNVPEDEKRKMVRDNAAKLYKLGNGR
ncbi:MAG: amidohydrolase [Chloroflexi bacterium]|nr:amidohydrolase [Chloroflexota bacterium]